MTRQSLANYIFGIEEVQKIKNDLMLENEDGLFFVLLLHEVSKKEADKDKTKDIRLFDILLFLRMIGLTVTLNEKFGFVLSGGEEFQKEKIALKDFSALLKQCLLSARGCFETYFNKKEA